MLSEGQMFNKIERNDKIFQSEQFLKDSLAFTVMVTILNNTEKYPSPKVFSNGKDCAIVNSDPKHSIIAWTADNFQEQEKLYEFIKKEFRTNDSYKIMAKKDFYDYLVKNHKIPKMDIQTLGVYSCPKLNDIKYIGHPDQAKPKEIKQIAQMIVNFGIETGEDPNAQLADYLEKAQEYLSFPTHCVWRDTNEKIVAIAHMNTDNNLSRISGVYTQREDRGKSYAKMLVHYLTGLSLKKGNKIMLFTDYDYQPSNRCYQAIGYELNCTIVNFTPSLI